MGDTCIITTIGQLNFFRWFISKKIFDYLLNKKDEVFEDMNKKNKNDKKIINKCLKHIKVKNKHIKDIQKKPLIINNNIEKKITNIVVSFM